MRYKPVLLGERNQKAPTTRPTVRSTVQSSCVQSQTVLPHSKPGVQVHHQPTTGSKLFSSHAVTQNSNSTTNSNNSIINTSCHSPLLPAAANDLSGSSGSLDQLDYLSDLSFSSTESDMLMMDVGLLDSSGLLPSLESMISALTNNISAATSSPSSLTNDSTAAVLASGLSGGSGGVEIGGMTPADFRHQPPPQPSQSAGDCYSSSSVAAARQYSNTNSSGGGLVWGSSAYSGAVTTLVGGGGFESADSGISDDSSLGGVGGVFDSFSEPSLSVF